MRAEYDRIQLVPGQRLWEQIGERVTKGPFDGWAYLLTPSSLQSEPCREELAYATYRALTDKGAAFPLRARVRAGGRGTSAPPGPWAAEDVP